MIPVEVPDGLGVDLDACVWQPVENVHSDAHVCRLAWDDGRVAYLKVAVGTGPGAGVDLLAAEHERLRWLQGRLPVPAVLAWARDDRAHLAALLTDALPGVPATAEEHRGDVESLIRAFALGLRRVHELPVGSCPFVTTVAARVALAAARVEAGVVDPADFEPAYARYTPAALLEVLVASPPEDPVGEDLVVVHGDYCLANVQLEHGEVVGYVDLARAGVGDRYVDLAIAARSLAVNVSPEALGPFFDTYGLDFPNLAKVDFYVLLDEFL